MSKNKFLMALIAVSLLLITLFLVLIFSANQKNNSSNDGNLNSSISENLFKNINQQGKVEISQFQSEEEFVNYLKNAPEDGNYYNSMRTGAFNSSLDMVEATGSSGPGMSGWSKGLGSSEPGRFSETNIQVQGIDEPDVLKTNGKQAYYSPKNSFIRWDEPIFEFSEDGRSSSSVTSSKNESITLGLNIFPLNDLRVNAEIPQKGQLLLNKDILTVMADDGKIYGYDVSDEKSPQEKWKMELGKNSRLISSRLYDNNLYLVTFSSFKNRKKPCSIEPMKINDQEVAFECQDIYHIKRPTAIDGIFQVMKVDPQTGLIDKKTSFAGNRQSGENLYMSPDALYLSYEESLNEFDFMLGFIRESKDVFPVEIVEKVEKLVGYDISNKAKFVEIERIMEDSFDLDDDDSKKLENEMENRMDDYTENHKRDFLKTGIVKINTKDLKIKETGLVPGGVLNQFSIDEYEGHLRVVTTIGGNFGFGSSSENENDLYVLDKNLEIVGQIQGMGLDERIYSARFVGDKGYMVTFKQIDPFFVFDLSDPKNPQKKGELKIPGYSSYLHPIGSNLVLGIGEENGQVKISLFDVTDPSNPFEKDKYVLKEHWSEIAETHHAFLIDQKNKIFFLPGRTGGYVFGYENEKLTLKKALDEVGVNRALYVDDYLYIFGREKVVVLDEKTWERVSELEFL